MCNSKAAETVTDAVNTQVSNVRTIGTQASEPAKIIGQTGGEAINTAKGGVDYLNERTGVGQSLDLGKAHLEKIKNLGTAHAQNAADIVQSHASTLYENAKGSWDDFVDNAIGSFEDIGGTDSGDDISDDISDDTEDVPSYLGSLFTTGRNLGQGRGIAATILSGGRGITGSSSTRRPTLLGG